MKLDANRRRPKQKPSNDEGEDKNAGEDKVREKKKSAKKDAVVVHVTEPEYFNDSDDMHSDGEAIEESDEETPEDEMAATPEEAVQVLIEVERTETDGSSMVKLLPLITDQKGYDSGAVLSSMANSGQTDEELASGALNLALDRGTGKPVGIQSAVSIQSAGIAVSESGEKCVILVPGMVAVPSSGGPSNDRGPSNDGGLNAGSESAGQAGLEPRDPDDHADDTEDPQDHEGDREPKEPRPQCSQMCICLTCQQSFKSPEELTEHRQKHRKKIKTKCLLCKARFPNEAELAEHMATHSGQTLLMCKLCGCVQSSLSQLRQHLLKHKPACTTCGKKFRSSQALKQHMKQHERQRNGYKCKHCERKFRSYQSWLYHVKSHGETPYSCSVCNKAFR